MLVTKTVQLPTRMDAGQESEHFLVEERITCFDGRVHRHAITLGVQEQAWEHNAGADAQGPVERMPAAHALQIQAQVVISAMLFRHFQHVRAEETQPGHAHQTEDVEPAVVPADGLLGTDRIGPGGARRPGQLRIESPCQLTQGQTGHKIEVAQRLVNLVPRVAGQPFVGPFARERHLVTERVDLACQEQQRGAGSIDHRPLGSPNERRIGVEHLGGAHTLHDQFRADVPGDEAGSIGLVQFWIFNAYRERGDGLLANVTCQRDHHARIDAAAQIRDDRHIGAQPAFHGPKQHLLEAI